MFHASLYKYTGGLGKAEQVQSLFDDLGLHRLRKKLAENASPSSPAKTPVIETIRGRGYRLIQPAE